MLARKLSLDAGLFVIVGVVLFVVLDAPLCRMLRKVFRTNIKHEGLAEVFILLVLTWLLSRWITPVASELLDSISEAIIKVLSCSI